MNSVFQLCALCSLMVCSSCFLTSCDDAELARSVNGFWYIELQIKDEYGNPFTEHQYLRFNYVDSEDKDGGDFQETVAWNMTEDIDGYKVAYDVKSTIKGDWEVLFGDLYMNYNLYSLEIKVTNLKISLSDDVDFMTQWESLDDVMYLNMNKRYLEKEARKEAYRMLRRQYEEDNSSGSNGLGSCYSNLRIEGDEMTFTASDIENMKWKRIRE